MKTRKTRHQFTSDELRGYYERVKNSARVSRNRKKYYRPSDKKVSD